MSQDVARFIPLAGLFIGLVVAFAFDPLAMRAAWWGPAGGFAIGIVARIGLQRYFNARSETGQDAR